MSRLLAAVLLALALAVPSAAQSRTRFNVTATAQPDGAVVVAWSIVTGATVYCVYRYEDTQIPLDCVPPDAVGLTLPPGDDAWSRVALGDALEVRAYGPRGALYKSVRSVVLWRVWLPVAGKAAGLSPAALAWPALAE